MIAPLTARQHQVLSLIAARLPSAPTIREIIAEIGGGHRSIHAQLARLERSGWIRRLPNRARAIELLREPPPRTPLTRAEGLAFARAWRIRMKPYFDGLYGQGG